MKNVWILNHYAKAPTSTGGSRHFQFARYLKDQGWRAVLIASSAEHISGKQKLEKNESFRHELISGVDFHWLRTPAYQGNGFQRMVNMLAYTIQAVRPSATKDLPPPDVIIGSSVHPFAALAAWWLARRHRVPFVFEVRDLWPQTLIDMGRLKDNGVAAKLMRSLEGFLYKRASKIITLLPFASSYLARFAVPDDKVVWMSNGVALDEYPELKRCPEDAKDRPFELMYYGSHGAANGLDTLINAMAVAKELLSNRDERVQLRLIGDGLEKDALITQARQMGIESRVSFEPPVPKSKIPEISAAADAFVITVRNLPELYKYGISMIKIFDYMASGRPVIIASNATNNPIADANAGITVAAEDAEALGRAIVEVTTMTPERRAELGANGRAHVAKEYDYRVLAKRLACSLNELVGST